MSTLIVIVNYRTADLTVDCLRSLADEISQTPDTRVLITDNDSGDDSCEKIAHAINQNHWDAWATLMPLDHNRGFAYGNNQAIRRALADDSPPDFVLLLNPDTIVQRGAVAGLVRFMNENPKAGIVGSRLEDLDGTPQRSAFRFHGIGSELDDGLRLGLASKFLSRYTVAPPIRDAPHQSDWVCGASFMIRRGVFDDIGLMDEGYFMYYEEVDFCLRAQRAGWACWYAPQSRVVHLVGQASGIRHAQPQTKRRPQYWFDARHRYFVKNHGLFYAALADAAWVIGFATYRLRRLIQRKPDMDPPRMLLDFLRHSVFFRGRRT